MTATARQAEGVVAGKSGDRKHWAFFEGLELGADGDPYLGRLRVIQTPWCGVYLHHIYRPDKDPDPHDHPWAFWSLVLCGSYREKVWPDKANPGSYRFRVRNRWSWARTGRDAAHIITRISRPLWTLVITGPRRSDWGFWENGEFVPWREYVARTGTR